jgi:hypothetical protein
MIAVQPGYFSWTTPEQERYRLTLPDEDEFRIQQRLLKQLFDIQANTQEELDTASELFNDEQAFLFNDAMLYFQGIGDDQFYLNEYLAENTTLLDFETLYDYDYDDHCFQENARQEQMSDYVVQPYRGALSYRWARLRIEGAFCYACLSTVANYLCGAADDIGFDLINELIPHEYVSGQRHGQPAKGGTLFDQKLVANGQEGQLEELQRRYYRYMGERQQAAAHDFDAKAQQRVYQVDKSQPLDPHRSFVFTDKTALQAVRFRHFMADCQAIIGDQQELDALIEQERQAAAEFLERNYQDIMKNFDPKVVQFRNKRNIVIADGALKAFLGW